MPEKFIGNPFNQDSDCEDDDLTFIIEEEGVWNNFEGPMDSFGVVIDETDSEGGDYEHSIGPDDSEDLFDDESDEDYVIDETDSESSFGRDENLVVEPAKPQVSVLNSAENDNLDDSSSNSSIHQ